MPDVHTIHKGLMEPVRAAQYDFSESSVRATLGALASDARIHLCHPLGDLHGSDAFFDGAYGPLFDAIPDLERRDFIVMAGADPQDNDWVGCAGHYVGTFQKPWLDIPPTGHVVAMRFHEFYRFENGNIAEIQAIWDIPELMIQAHAWPMVPSLGRNWQVPGPATQDGLVPGPYDEPQGRLSRQLITDMLDHMIRYPLHGGPEVMELPRFWHDRMTWYGPAGIGTARGFEGFGRWHQGPFLTAMPDRGQYPVVCHIFGDGQYAAATGWPNMTQTLSHSGWLGIAPSGTRITMRSLDFWRMEKNRIKENWVLVDLLHMYDQIGVDPLERMRQFNQARPGFDDQTGQAL